MSMVKYKCGNVFVLSVQYEVELKVLVKKLDDEIDYSDIFVLEDGQWFEVVCGKFFCLLKIQVLVCIDVDVMEWLKWSGKGYQMWLNVILCEVMLCE